MNTDSWKGKFISILSEQNITVEHINKAFDIKNKNLPKSVFKYRSVDEFSLSNLETDHVWCSSPDQYNDPYDTALTFSPDVLRKHITRSNFYKYLEQLGHKNVFSENEIKRAEMSLDPLVALFALLGEKFSENANGQYLQKQIHEQLKAANSEMVVNFTKSLQRDMAICSFSETNDSIVMWGHYAQKHTGFCIEYDLDQLTRDDIRRRFIYPVIYTERLLDVTQYFLSAHKDKNNFNNLFCILSAIYKSKDWQYEKEWRFIHPIGDVVNKYPMPKPKTIFIGSRISKEDSDKIKKIGKDKGIPVIQMEISNSEYKIIPSGEAV